MCFSISSSVETISDKFNQLLSEVGTIGYNNVMILGNLESEWKNFSTQKFTKHTDPPVVKIQNNTFYPQTLMATSDCIGVVLDYFEVCAVARDVFPIVRFRSGDGMTGKGHGLNNKQKGT